MAIFDDFFAAGRPSRWALAHISSNLMILRTFQCFDAVGYAAGRTAGL